jgi:hypothetical protein
LLPSDWPSSTDSFTWTHGKVRFESTTCYRVVREHVMNRHIPETGGENARINLWSMKGVLAHDGSAEVVIKSCEFKAEQ